MTQCVTQVLFLAAALFLETAMRLVACLVMVISPFRRGYSRIVSLEHGLCAFYRASSFLNNYLCVSCDLVNNLSL